jgi:carbon storage regulator CsrA
VSLILTRRPGEAILFQRGGKASRLYVVAIEGNVVRLAIDADEEVRILREELLPEEARRQWREDLGGGFARVALFLATSLITIKIQFLL